ncbi:hypothetical protein Bca101_089480 [Brassica carinata]
MSRFTAIFILLTLLAVQGFNPSLCDDEDNEIGSCILTHSVTVSGDGSGDFKTISEAVASVPNNNKIRFNIFVKEGQCVDLWRGYGKDSDLQQSKQVGVSKIHYCFHSNILRILIQEKPPTSQNNNNNIPVVEASQPP